MDRVLKILLCAALGATGMLALHCALHPDCDHAAKH